jgi:hypothetical protein
MKTPRETFNGYQNDNQTDAESPPTQGHVRQKRAGVKAAPPAAPEKKAHPPRRRSEGDASLIDERPKTPRKRTAQELENRALSALAADLAARETRSPAPEPVPAPRHGGAPPVEEPSSRLRQ